MIPGTVPTSGPDDPGGHGANERHGRFSFPAEAQSLEPALLQTAMQHLLTLGGAQARSGQCVVGGLRLHYLEAGQGPTLVLLHGASGGAANWFRLIQPLAQTYHVLVPDLPGFGFSQALQPRAPLGWQVAELLEQWLEQLNVTRADIVATSFGGLVALRLAQRAETRVRTLALVDSVGLGQELSWVARLASLNLLSALLTRPSRRSVRWQLRTLMVAQIERIAPELVTALLEYLYQSAVAADGSHMARALHQFASLRGQREVLSDRELAALPQPVLVAWGEHDRFLPVKHARRAAALVQRAQLSIIPGAGHSPNWEAPGVLFEIVSAFLRENSHS